MSKDEEQKLVDELEATGRLFSEIMLVQRAFNDISEECQASCPIGWEDALAKDCIVCPRFLAWRKENVVEDT